MPPTPLSREADRPKRLEGHRLFLLDFLRRPREVASVIPSSRFLERRIVRAAAVDAAKTVVELGPGTGGTSRAFLRAMAPDTRLLCIEINDRFAEHLERELDDPRVIVHRGDARDLRAILDTYQLPSPDAVLSGIPFSTIPQEVGLGILRSVHEALVPGGRFVAYQVRDRVEVLGRTIFGPAEAVTEYRNVPPARVFTWRKAQTDFSDAS